MTEKVIPFFIAGQKTKRIKIYFEKQKEGNKYKKIKLGLKTKRWI